MKLFGLFFTCLLFGVAAPAADQPISAPVGGVYKEAAPTADEEGIWTGVVFGVKGERPDDGVTPADPRADSDLISQILVTADWKAGYVRLASVRTDMLVADSSFEAGYGTMEDIYRTRGPEGCMEALSRNLDVKADDYFVVPWKAAVDAVNSLGGIDIELTEDEMYWFNAEITETVRDTGVPSTMQKKTGLIHIDGVQAVAYMNLPASGQGIKYTPEEMAARRHTVSEQVLKKAASAGLLDLKDLLETVEPQIATSFTTQDFITALSGCRTVKSVESMCIPQTYSQGKGKAAGGIFPDTLEENAVYLNSFLYNDINYVCPEAVRGISRELENARIS